MKFARRMNKYIGKPFLSGGADENGYDCFGMIYSWCNENGIVIEPIDGWSRENYHVRMMEEKEEAERILIEAFKSIGQHVDNKKILAGDIIIVKSGVSGLFPAIFCGNGRAVSSFIIAGTRLFSLKDIEIIMARRII